MMSNNILSQLKRFVLVGMMSVSLDWGSYILLTHIFEFGTVFSKSTSYVIGTAFAFITNGILVFESEIVPENLIKHILIYSFSLLANTLVFRTLVIFIDSESRLILSAALAGATLISTVINFFGMRYWVFKHKRFGYASG